MKIRFIQAIKIPGDKVKEWTKYIVGSIHEVNDSEAERWLRRGSAEIVNTVRAVGRRIEEVEILKVAEEKSEEIKVEETGDKVEDTVVSVGTISSPLGFPQVLLDDLSKMGIRYVSERHMVIDDVPTPVPFWEIKKIYDGKTVVVLGGGPSHVEIDIDFLRDFNFLAVNSSCRKVEKITKADDILYFSDNSWAERFEKLITNWSGICVTSNRNTKARLGNLVNRLDIQNLTEFMQIKSDYVQASSGHTAVCLAAWLGAKRIILIGFECKSLNGKTHGHTDYSQGDLNAFQERYIPGWIGLSKRFIELGIEVINSTPDSEIKEFKYLDFKKALEYV